MATQSLQPMTTTKDQPGRDRRGAALAVFSAVSGGGAAIGLLLGGLRPPS
jgi:hypothetical protein